MTPDITKLSATLPDIPLVPLDQPTETVYVMELPDYELFQIVIILGADHIWLMGIDLHHDPRNDPQDKLFDHWINSGAAKRFSEHYKVVTGPDNFARNFGTPMYSA